MADERTDASAPDVEEFTIEWNLDPAINYSVIPNEVEPLGLLTVQQEETTHNVLSPGQANSSIAETTAEGSAPKEFLPDDYLTFNWTEDRGIFKSSRETFTGNPGPTFDVTERTTPTDVFHKMFDLEFIDMLCIETNRYASQKIQSHNYAKNSRVRNWTPTDRPEMISFLALMILQGLYSLSNEASYFSFNGFGTMPYFSRIMTYNRYILLKSMFHFVDNEKLADVPTKSKLFKIQPVIDYFNAKFSSLYYPKQDIAIDESLMKWHGMLSFVQKIKNKAAKQGVKTYELCESSTGYLWRFIVYTGKKGAISTTDANDNDNDNDNVNDNDNPGHVEKTERTEQTGQNIGTDIGLSNSTAKVVFDLIEPLLDRGHTLIMDNFYNCPLLARCLKQRKTDCYGTLRLNRRFIPSSIRMLAKNDLQHSEMIAVYCPDLSLMVWRDAVLLGMISTYHKFKMNKCFKANKVAFKPNIVQDYNKNMGGIDRKDQYLSAHPIERVRGRVWYKKLFRRIYNSALFNCFVIFNTKHKIPHRRFRTVLAESLLKMYKKIDLTTETRLTCRNVGHKRTLVKQRNVRLTFERRPIVEGDHFPVHAENKRGRCWWCTHKRTVSSRTMWKCAECDVNLCILGCFREFHKP